MKNDLINPSHVGGIKHPAQKINITLREGSHPPQVSNPLIGGDHPCRIPQGGRNSECHGEDRANYDSNEFANDESCRLSVGRVAVNEVRIYG